MNTYVRYLVVIPDTDARTVRRYVNTRTKYCSEFLCTYVRVHTGVRVRVSEIADAHDLTGQSDASALEMIAKCTMGKRCCLSFGSDLWRHIAR
jgi:hypothetical protein